MSQKSLMLGLPAALLLGGSAIAIGVLPGVRDWVDQTIPWLGINGVKPSESNSLADRTSDLQKTMIAEQPVAPEFSMQRMEQLQTPSMLPARSDVAFAGGTAIPTTDAPFLNSNDRPIPRTDVRLAQARTLDAVPQAGQYVPSRDRGTVSLERAQVKFVDINSIAAQAEGRIDKLNVDEGSMIEAGVPMIEIDTRMVLKEIRVAERELDAAKLKANDVSNVNFSKAALEVAQAEVKISEDLFAKGAEGTMEGLKKRLELKKAGYQVDVSKIEKERDGADVDVKEAKLEAAKVQLELRTINAPRTGVITEVLKRQYDWVRAGEVIVKLVSLKRLRIKGQVVVSDSPNLLENAPARVTITIAPGLKGETIDGVVSYVSPQTAIEKDRYDVYVDVENRLTPEGQYMFREGMTVEVEITPRKR